MALHATSQEKWSRFVLSLVSLLRYQESSSRLDTAAASTSLQRATFDHSTSEVCVCDCVWPFLLRYNFMFNFIAFITIISKDFHFNRYTSNVLVFFIMLNFKLKVFPIISMLRGVVLPLRLVYFEALCGRVSHGLQVSRRGFFQRFLRWPWPIFTSLIIWDFK